MDTSPKSLAGQTALVTGAARRLGRALALSLATHGVHVAIHYRTSAAEAETAAEAARAHGVRAVTLPADLAAPGQVETLLPRASAALGPIDMLINSASIFPENRLPDVTTEDFAHSIQVNALAPFVLARALAAQGRSGAIVNLLDARMNDCDTQHAAYHVSKRVLFTLTRMMALEFAPRVRVNAVAPGLILPPVGADDSYLKKLAHTNPLQRHGGAEDVVAAALFLLRSPFITGQVIYVDGGRHMRGAVYG